MGYKPTQRDIVIIDFAPSKGYEIRKRRPALVMSKEQLQYFNKFSYCLSNNLVG